MRTGPQSIGVGLGTARVQNEPAATTTRCRLVHSLASIRVGDPVSPGFSSAGRGGIVGI